MSRSPVVWSRLAWARRSRSAPRSSRYSPAILAVGCRGPSIPVGDEAFRAACADREIPVVVHAPHLINLCSPSDLVLSRSVAALAVTMQRAAAIGATAVVVHAGSLVAKCRRAAVLG